MHYVLRVGPCSLWPWTAWSRCRKCSYEWDHVNQVMALELPNVLLINLLFYVDVTHSCCGLWPFFNPIQPLTDERHLWDLTFNHLLPLSLLFPACSCWCAGGLHREFLCGHSLWSISECKGILSTLEIRLLLRKTMKDPGRRKAKSQSLCMTWSSTPATCIHFEPVMISRTLCVVLTFKLMEAQILHHCCFFFTKGPWKKQNTFTLRITIQMVFSFSQAE